MAAIFTPGLKVSEHTVLVKDRRLPIEGEVLVEVGQQVGADEIVARTELPGKIYPVNVANQLAIDPGRLGEAMIKAVGDSVAQGDVVARSPGLFGLFKSEATAPVSGTIESISTITGQVIYQAAPIPVEVDAYIRGRVIEVIEGEGCVIQAAATLIQGIFGLGGEVKAELAMAVEAPADVLDVSAITPELAGKIAVGGSYATLEGIQAAIKHGLAGIVTGGFDYDEIKELLGYEVGVAITGGEDLGLTLIVTEGFGKIQMAPATFALLSKKAGSRASINGATQIRAGVIRPEVVVTFDDEQMPADRIDPGEPRGIAIGDEVRGIRAPWFGRLGEVTDLPVEPVVLGSGSPARVMEVRFEDGTVARIPRANVEVIEQ
ncbi:MAG TPA: hypothetical protein ENK18_06040 [Deltaproteobacteria bacterium]|nr:hypothetical protein [Deltaproteobacteria bacterium]